VYAELGFALTHERYAKSVGTSWEAVFDSLAGHLGPDTRAWFAREVHHRYNQAILQGVPVVPGGADLLRTLGPHTRLGIVTGSSRVQLEAAIAQLGIGGLLDVTVSDDDITRSKPDPEGYEQALEALGVDPRRTIIFEDSTAGIGAGLAAGCKVVAVTCTNHFEQDQTGAHAHVSDLTDVGVDFCRGLFDS
jgi:HAD superfamily hydrolase (TIGR01509 family)